jgi:putative amino-acid transport system ATP-binding protein
LALEPEWVGEVLGLMRRIAESHQIMLSVTRKVQFSFEIADLVVIMEAAK